MDPKSEIYYVYKYNLEGWVKKICKVNASMALENAIHICA